MQPTFLLTFSPDLQRFLMRFLLTPLLGASLCFFVHDANAARQCLPGATCNEDEAVSLAAMIVGAERACSQIDPGHKDDYAAVVNQLVSTEREAFEKAKKSPRFAKTLKAYEEELNGMPQDKLVKKCAKALKKLNTVKGWEGVQNAESVEKKPAGKIHAGF